MTDDNIVTFPQLAHETYHLHCPKCEFYGFEIIVDQEDWTEILAFRCGDCRHTVPVEIRAWVTIEGQEDDEA